MTEATVYTITPGNATGLKWRCARCHTYNMPRDVWCRNEQCLKQRWEQLGVDERAALRLAALIYDGGY